MSNQDVFDAALKQVRGQGVQCVDSQGSCMYRGSDVGCAFSPAIETYDAECESNDCSWFFDESKPERLELLYDWAREADQACCESIQDCHDTILTIKTNPTVIPAIKMEFMESFEAKMLMVAEQYELNYEPAKKETVVPQV